MTGRQRKDGWYLFEDSSGSDKDAVGVYIQMITVLSGPV